MNIRLVDLGKNRLNNQQWTGLSECVLIVILDF